MKYGIEEGLDVYSLCCTASPYQDRVEVVYIKGEGTKIVGHCNKCGMGTDFEEIEDE